MKPQPHNHKKEYLTKLAGLIDNVIAASDDFENARGKLASKLSSGQKIEDQEVKDMLAKKVVATEKHLYVVACVLNHKHCCSDRERADIGEALAYGYRHLKDLLSSYSRNI